MLNSQPQLRFGLNYIPSSRWWYCWLDWDITSIREDLEAISQLGMDHIRIHCLWPVFQPDPNYISETALDRLEQLLDAADAAGLDVCVTVLDGWLSGYAFVPAWQKKRNLFTDRHVVEAQRRLFVAIATRIGLHQRFLGFDLGNELGCMCGFGNPITPEEGDLWHQEMMALCEDLAPGKLHVNGVDHQPWFADAAFSRRVLANSGAMTSVHAWIEFTGARALYGADGIGSLHLAEYCIELAKAYSENLARQVWLQEFGASSQWMPVDSIPDFAEIAMFHAACCSNLWGMTWWCSHDISDVFTEFDSLERDLGLLDSHNNVKPVGQRLAKTIRRMREDRPKVASRSTALVIEDNMCSSGWRIGKSFMHLVKDGERPCIILADRCDDIEYLTARGITTFVHI